MILFRRYLIYLLAVILIAVGFTYISAKLYEEFAFIRNDNWQILPSPGDQDRDIYTRASVAMSGTFALAKPEAAYFHAFYDIEDEELSGNCSYQISGSDIESRWWSITVYNEDGFLVKNDEKIYSLNSETVDFNLEGGFNIYLTGDNNFISKNSGENWLRTPIDNSFSVALRIYLPGEEYFSKLKRVDLPIIEKLECRDE